MNILFVLSYARAAANILPAIEQVATTERVYYYNYRLMASTHRWPGGADDIRPALLARLERAGAIGLGEPERPHSSVADTYSGDFKRAIANVDLDVAVFDENVGVLRWGSPLMYRVLRGRGVPVVACQEGVVEDDAPGLQQSATNLGVQYDYCFCIGGWDADRLLARNPHLGGRLFAVGLPGNDPLGNASERAKKHVLLLTGYMGPTGPDNRFSAMTEELIGSCGAYRLAEEAHVPLVIKEKAANEFGLKHLENDGVRVTMDETDLDSLVGDSLYVIGAPSTLLIKAIEARVPTAVLGEPYMGQRGGLEEFAGFTDSTAGAVRGTLQEQRRSGGVDAESIERLAAGGSTFSSSQRFVDALNGVVAGASAYNGPLAAKPAAVNRWGSRFPGAFKLAQRYYHALKGDRRT
jgi:hypothetical protein